MSDQSEQPLEYVEPKKLDSVFATTASGQILEIPQSEAGKYVLTDARLAEIGHPPVAPLGGESEEEVAGGRHMIPGSPMGDPSGWHWHTGWEFGSYQAPDGSFYVGIHRHPHGDQRAQPADPQDFS